MSRSFLAHAEPRRGSHIRFDPALAAGDSGRSVPLSDAEKSILTRMADECLAQARTILSAPVARQHFRSVYHLDPVELLDRPGFAIVLRTFPVRWDIPASRRTVQVGAYFFGESTIAMNVQLLLACLPNRDVAAWKRYISGVIVHELAHLADFVDDGVNNNGGMSEQVEEGELAQRTCRAFFRIPAPLEPPGPMLAAWRNVHAQAAELLPRRRRSFSN